MIVYKTVMFLIEKLMTAFPQSAFAKMDRFKIIKNP